MFKGYVEESVAAFKNYDQPPHSTHFGPPSQQTL
jgi:hypothetical protein